MRKDKPGRIKKKEFLKYSGTSRRPRHPFHKTRQGEKFQHYEQGRTDKKRSTTCDRPESVEKQDNEKEFAKETEKQRSDFALWAEAKPDSNRTELELEKKYPVGDTPENDLEKDPGKDPRKGSGKVSEQVPEKGPWKDPEKDPGKGSGKVPEVLEKDLGKNLGKCSGNNPLKDPGKGPRKDLGKDERGVTDRGNNIKSSQNSYGERPRSARGGRGRSGRGKPSSGSSKESRDGVRNTNNSFTFFGEVVKRSLSL